MKHSLLTLSLALALPLIASNASAQEPALMDAPPPPVVTSSNDTLRRFSQVELGFRAGFMRDSGYDPFSTNDMFTQFSVGGTRTLFVDRALSIAAGVRWDYGRASATARGAEASLSMHRLAVPLEARYHVTRWMYAFARLAPGAMRTSASLTDGSSADTLTDAHWTFSADASLGSAFLVGPHSAPTRHLGRWWFTQELGYGWTQAKALDMGVAPAEDDFRQYGSIALRPIAMRGVFFRLGVALTF